MHPNRRLHNAMILFALVVILGTAGYMLIEDYNLLDAFYIVMITVTTVGFGEVKSLSDAGRIFTVLLILLGFSSIGLVGTAMAESLLDNIWSGKTKMKKIRNSIQALSQHYIICGGGRVGMAVVEDFHKAGVDFILLDQTQPNHEVMQEINPLFIQGDATHEAVLEEAGIKRAKGIVALLGSDPANLYIVLTAREMNPLLHIVSRAEDQNSIKRIRQAGADLVISTFASAGKQIATEVLKKSGRGQATPTIEEPAQPQLHWVAWQSQAEAEAPSLQDWSQAQGCQVVGLRRGEKDQLNPDPRLPLQRGDQLLVLGLNQNNAVNQRQTKVVIVDDNPSILRLYVRLFQKAGYHPLTAREGEEGLKLILREKPEVAVVDYFLPQLSGIELCRKVRSHESCSQTKLILFTADEQAQTKIEALEAGVNQVVVKSPDAFKVIRAVAQGA